MGKEKLLKKFKDQMSGSKFVFEHVVNERGKFGEYDRLFIFKNEDKYYLITKWFDCDFELLSDSDNENEIAKEFIAANNSRNEQKRANYQNLIYNDLKNSQTYIVDYLKKMD